MPALGLLETESRAMHTLSSHTALGVAVGSDIYVSTCRPATTGLQQTPHTSVASVRVGNKHFFGNFLEVSLF